MDKKRMKRMVGIVVPIVILIIGISYNGYVKTHTFTLSGEGAGELTIRPVNVRIE